MYGAGSKTPLITSASLILAMVFAFSSCRPSIRGATAKQTAASPTPTPAPTPDPFAPGLHLDAERNPVTAFDPQVVTAVYRDSNGNIDVTFNDCLTVVNSTDPAFYIASGCLVNGEGTLTFAFSAVGTQVATIGNSNGDPLADFELTILPSLPDGSRPVQTIALSAPYSTLPRDVTVMNGSVYFTAIDGSSDRRLYKVNGTSYQAISDTNLNGDDNSSILFAAGTNLYFNSYDSSSSPYLYVYDGTSVSFALDTNGNTLYNVSAKGNYGYLGLAKDSNATYFRTNDKVYRANGTTLVPIDFGVGSYQPRTVAYFNGNVVVYLTAGSNGYIAKFDAAGTPTVYATSSTWSGYYIKDDAFLLNDYSSNYAIFTGSTVVVMPGITSVDPFSLVTITNKAYFRGQGPAGFKMYYFDGTSVTDLTASYTCDFNNSTLVVYNGNAYGTCSTPTGTGVARLNGTSSTKISALYGNGLHVKSSGLYFANSGQWAKYDGTSVTSVGAAYGSSLPMYWNRIFGDNFYYWAGDPNDSNIFRLFRFNGVTNVPVSKVNINSRDIFNELMYRDQQFPFYLAENGADTYFVYQATYLPTLYKHSAGVSTLIAPTSGFKDTSANSLMVSGNHLFFMSRRASDAGPTLHMMDANQTITPVAASNGGVVRALSTPSLMGSWYYYIGTYTSSTTDVAGLFRIQNGTSQEIAGAYTINNPTSSQYPVIWNNKFYFGANSNSSGAQTLGIYDGTSLTFLHDIAPAGIGGCDSIYGVDGYHRYQSYNSMLVMVCYDNSLNKDVLYTYDGTSMTRYNDAVFDGLYYLTYTSIGVFYQGYDNNLGVGKLYKFDGTQSVQVSDLSPGSYDDFKMNDYIDGTLQIANSGGQYYFFADPTQNSIYQLYKFNSTNNTLASMPDFEGEPVVNISDIEMLSGQPVVIADLPNHGYRYLLKWDGTSAWVKVLEDQSGSNLSKLTQLNGKLYFNNISFDGTWALWEYNGTSIKQISATNPGGGSINYDAINAGSKIAFTAIDQGGKQQIFEYDGSHVTQLSNSTVYGDYFEPVVFNGYLYFSSMDFNGNDSNLDSRFEILRRVQVAP